MVDWGSLAVQNVQNQVNQLTPEQKQAWQAFPMATSPQAAAAFDTARQRQIQNNQQLANAGVQETIGTQVNAGGIGGFFGDTKGYPIYTPQQYTDPNYANNKTQLAVLQGELDKMPSRFAGAGNSGEAATAQGALIDPTQQAQFRQQQMGLAQQLMSQANGQGPSVAGSQLQQSTEQNLQAAMAQAASARGGNLGAMQYQLGNARANIQQQAAMGLAQARIQEQMAARSQLGDVLNSGRGADIGLASQQAQLGQQNAQFNAGQLQQNNQFNAGLLQNTNQFNVNAGMQQDQYKMNMKAQLLQQGYSEDQANLMLGLQQTQFTAGLINQGIAAGNGISTQNAAQGIQLAGAAAGAIGSGIGSALSYMNNKKG